MRSEIAATKTRNFRTVGGHFSRMKKRQNTSFSKENSEPDGPSSWSGLAGFVLKWTQKSTMASLVALDKAKAAAENKNAEEGV